jgi:hypothetical protein
MSTYMPFQNKILLIVILLVSFSFAQESLDTGKLSIQLETPGYIYIDSEILSNQSVENLLLKPGKYKISVFSAKSRKWNERGYENIITIQPNENINLNVENTNLYYINSDPYSGNIIQNNTILGRTPAYINSSNIDESKKLVLQKNGFYEKDISLNPDQSNYFFKLKPESIKNEIQLASQGIDNSQTSWFKEGFVVVSLLSSWAAFYFKREADKNYNKYLREGNSSLLNKYYDRTKRFDTYSDISISVSITSLGTYMYFLFFD